jgi:ABC-2 type transport system ATP-binding protein
MEHPSPAIEVEGLVKTYGTVEAVRDVSFTVGRGEVFGFLGPNGAGKSTTINVLCTLLRPSGGTARVSGFDVVDQRDDVRRHIGLVFQDPTLDGQLTAAQNLRLHADLYGIDRDVAAERIDQLLAMVDLAERRDAPVLTFSGGMKRRLEIARGLMHSPPVLFLDEPTIGLDPQTRSAIWTYIGALREGEGTTIFMTTHYMDEAELCDRIAIIDRGEIVVLDTPDALKADAGVATLNDVFLHHTGATIRDDGAAPERQPNMMSVFSKAGRLRPPWRRWPWPGCPSGRGDPRPGPCERSGGGR